MWYEKTSYELSPLLLEMLKDLCLAGMDCMSSVPGKQESYKNVIASLLSIVIAFVIIGFVGKYLWNITMPELFSFARPVQSAWQVIGLMILLSLFR